MLPSLSLLLLKDLYYVSSHTAAGTKTAHVRCQFIHTGLMATLKRQWQGDCHSVRPSSQNICMML